VYENQKRMLIIAVMGVLVVILFTTMWIINLNNFPSSSSPMVTSTNSPIPTVIKPAPSVEVTVVPSVEPAFAVIDSPVPVAQSLALGSDDETAEFGKTVKDVPYNYETMVSAATIRLDSDPLIEGIDISTFVSLRDEAFTIFFKEAVDQDSVKAAFERNYLMQSKQPFPKMLLYWTSERQLHVKVLAAQIKVWEPYSISYFLDLSGITNVAGEVIQEENHENIRFNAIVEQQINQLWKFSLNGAKQEQLTNFTEPYTIEPLDENNEHLLLSRPSRYCGCDALYPAYYSMWDTSSSKLTAYPLDIQLLKNYQGAGAFVADSRGFFFEQPTKKMEAPQSDSAHLIQLADFVFGASFSKNRENLILAVGKKEQTNNYDLLILNLKSNTQQRYPHVIKGNTPEDQAYGRILPFVFIDDGKRIYFNSTNWETHKDLNYYYEWESKKLISWSPPEEVTGWTGFTESSDGIFRIYANGGLFKNGQHQKTSFMIENYYGGIWIPKTHHYVVQERSSDKEALVFLDADTLTLTPLIHNLPSDPRLHSISSDGKWLTLSMQGKLQ
jgi:hypothetical protein